MVSWGADVDALRAWGASPAQRATTVDEVIRTVEQAVVSVPWVGLDHDAFIDQFRDAAVRGCRDALARLRAMSEDAVLHADEQDAASSAAGTVAATSTPGAPNAGDRSTPGETEDSGPPVPVPDSVQDDVGDVEAIRQGALDVNQGSMGDCYFLASLAAIAQTNPEFIEENIWFSDGKYHVRLYTMGRMGPEEVVIEVNPEVAENGVRDANGNITWMSVYEAAYAQERGGYENIEDGGFAHDALRTITGNPAVRHDDEPSFEEIRSDVDQGHVVVADTASREGDDGGWWDVVNNDDGPVPDDTVSTHQYVVRGFTEDGRIVMQNPWGPDGGFQAGDDVHKPGQLILTEDEYRERFEHVTVTEDPDTSNPVQPQVVE